MLSEPISSIDLKLHTSSSGSVRNAEGLIDRTKALMIIPRWGTIGLFVMVVIQFILSWLQAKKTEKNFREAVLPAALIAAAVSIIFLREFFGDLPVWNDASVTILCSIIILFLIGLAAVRLKRYLKDAWRLEGERDQ